ncbi:hypothetical protein MBLNU457_g2602t1 [Dothideomycetes sp. NU457]
MLSTTLLTALLSLTNLAISAPTPASSPLPLVIWHGLGDRFDADGIAAVGKLAKKVHPGTYIYPIRVADEGGADARASFFGNLSAQIDQVCTNLTSNPHLSANNTRIDALGFSQGGQFLRGLVERCPGIEVRSLVTFGSQHNGIAKFQECGTFDLLCKGAIAAIKGNAWGEWVQSNIVPAQYYREKAEGSDEGSKDYLKHSNFLADVNNERKVKNEIYKERLGSLSHFAMYVFENDTTVLPKESGWFAEVNATSLEVTPLRERTLYKEDWLGLKKLDYKGALAFRTVDGAKHMELNKEVLTEAFTDFFGPESILEPVVNQAKGLWQQVVMNMGRDW